MCSLKNPQMRETQNKKSDTYGSELDKRVEQLYDQWHGLFVDVGVQDV